MIASSSNDPAMALSRLHPEQLTVLVDILRRSTVRHSSFVEGVYKDRARHFPETLQFLKEIGWAKEDAGQLALVGPAASFSEEGFRPYRAVEDLAETSGPLRTILARYLAEFRNCGGRIIHRPSVQSRLQQSGVRNFLIEVGILTHQAEEDDYTLNPQFSHLYLWAKNVCGTTSKTELLHRMSERDQLGTAAELVVLGFEKERLGSDLSSRVEHVSAQNPGACFDIKSLSITNGQPIPRFIEVKAVPADSYQFFWTTGELEAALLLGPKYFLYLIPVSGRHRFDLSKMEVIEDPYRAVYRNPEAWEKNENVIVCRRKPLQNNL